MGLELVEREHIERVLKTVGGNKSKAARLLGTDVTVESTEGVGSPFSLDVPGGKTRSAPS